MPRSHPTCLLGCGTPSLRRGMVERLP
ncbi:hypothetical protein EI555_011139 [Monodon monoceros]|uniref:Uncharacterized protein n=1 Tax=Monodon monoceros TaxID=40151 RepID=A0A4U1F5W1_MONMO|nr:hypothetical protein EI555_011139 [Monodon monoceros]